MTIKLEYDEALSLLKDVVKEKGPEYVYEKQPQGDTGGWCVYFADDGTPSCIVGHVLARKGMTLKELGDYNVETDVQGLVEDDVIDVDGKTQKLLYKAQEKQDHGHTWGVALQAAVEAAEDDDYDG